MRDKARVLHWAFLGSLVLAVVSVIVTGVVLAQTPVGQDTRGCPPDACDPLLDISHRQAVFFIGAGVTLVLLTIAVVLRYYAGKPKRDL